MRVESCLLYTSGAGSSLYSVYDELVRRYNEKLLSFRNVVVFNAYEYYPLQKDSSLRTINQCKERFLDHVDVAEQNIFTLDGFCLLYTSKPGLGS